MDETPSILHRKSLLINIISSLVSQLALVGRQADMLR